MCRFDGMDSLNFGSKPTYICGMEQLLQQIEAYKQEIGSVQPMERTRWRPIGLSSSQQKAL